MARPTRGPLLSNLGGREDSGDRGYRRSYLTGNRLVWEHKRDGVKAQKGKREGVALDREFHRVFLTSGNMPVSFLRRVMKHKGLLA